MSLFFSIVETLSPLGGLLWGLSTFSNGSKTIFLLFVLLAPESWIIFFQTSMSNLSKTAAASLENRRWALALEGDLARQHPCSSAPPSIVPWRQKLETSKAMNHLVGVP
ncbi:hypothetical protein ACNKHN_08505 [Shigella flexneri]